MSKDNLALDSKATTTLKARYERLTTTRQTFLDRARSCAELTLPTLIPPEGYNSTTVYHTPWQSIGARGANNLAAKLLLTLFPPNTPVFKLNVNEYTKAEMAGDDALKSKIDEGLAQIERTTQDEIESSGLRNPVFLALKHLVVGGNCFMYLPKDKENEDNILVYSLNQYVCRRDRKGNLLEVITEEWVSPETLDEEFANLLQPDVGVESGDTKRHDGNEDIPIYTRFCRDGKKWKTYQEINGQRVPGTEGSWPLHKPAFMALRWTAVQGEDYGRGYVEEVLGDLISLEGLSKAMVESSANAAKTIFMVAPNSSTRAQDLAEAENGDFVSGLPDDVRVLQIEKHHDLAIAEQAINRLEQRLALAFMLNTAIQRPGERVTAEEIRFMAQELESALGGVYSVLSQEFQLPLVIRIMDRMTKAKKLPKLPEEVVKPKVVTGLEALGRGHDAMKLREYFMELQVFGPEAIQRLHVGEAMSRLAVARAVDPQGLVKTNEEVQEDMENAKAQQQEQQMGEAMSKAAPTVAKAAMGQ